MFLPHDVKDTRNAYHAFMAALCMFDKVKYNHPHVVKLVCPALCTGYGRMPHETAVSQMYSALEDFVRNKRPHQRMKSDIPWCYIAPLRDHEQPKNFDNREIQENNLEVSSVCD